MNIRISFCSSNRNIYRRQKQRAGGCPIWITLSAETALNLKRESSAEITTVILCLGTFGPIFGGFLSPFLELPAPEMPSLTPAAPLAFPV